MKQDLYDQARWLESGERVERVLRSRAKYKLGDGLVTRMIYADFVLTSRRVAILTGFLRKRLSTEIRPAHVVAVAAQAAFEERGVYWRPAWKRVLLLTVRKDGKDARLGIAVGADEVEAWRDRLQTWVDAKRA